MPVIRSLDFGGVELGLSFDFVQVINVFCSQRCLVFRRAQFDLGLFLLED